MAEKLSVAKGVRTIREHLGLSRSALSAKAGCSAAHIEMIEREERSPSLEIVAMLAEALCCDAASLFSQPSEDTLKEIEIAYRRQELQQLEAETGAA